MSLSYLENQLEPQPLDEATKAAVELGREQLQRGKSVTLEESTANRLKRLKEFRAVKGDIHPG